MGSHRAGLMIIRAWVEPDSAEPLRVEVRIVIDSAAGIERTVTLSRADVVAATVQEWLADIVSTTDDTDEHHDPAVR